jgi:hypothetical protein
MAVAVAVVFCGLSLRQLVCKSGKGGSSTECAHIKDQRREELLQLRSFSFSNDSRLGFYFYLALKIKAYNI